jgi:hypothetical protein
LHHSDGPLISQQDMPQLSGSCTADGLHTVCSNLEVIVVQRLKAFSMFGAPFSWVFVSFGSARTHGAAILVAQVNMLPGFYLRFQPS